MEIIEVVEAGDDAPVTELVDLLTRGEEIRPKM